MYNKLVELIVKHLEPNQLEIAQTYKFMIADFVAALKKLTQTCNVGIYLEKLLRDKFVHGLRNESVLKNYLM